MPMISTIGRRATSVRLLISGMYVLLALGALSMIYPFIIMIAGTTKSSVDLNDVNMVPAFLLDDEPLFQKHMEGLFNERIQFAKTSLDKPLQAFSDFQLTPFKPSGLLPEWQQFIANENLDPSFSFAGYMHTPQSLTTPLNLRKFKKQMQLNYAEKIDNVNTELGVSFVSWNAFFVNSPFPLPRIKSQAQTGWSETLKTFSAEQPDAYRYWFSVEGFFHRQFLESRYTGQIQRYNESHGTDYINYNAIPLHRSFPSMANETVQQDWELFVRKILHLKWINLNDTGLPRYRAYLKNKYGSSENLSRIWDQALHSFNEVQFPKGQSASKQTADLATYISGWTDPQSQEHFEAPIESIEIVSVEFLFRDYLLQKYGTLENINQTLGSSFLDILNIAPPQYEQHLQAFQSIRKDLRWEFSTRNFIKVLDFMLYHGRGVWNTVIYCGLSIVLALIVNPLAAYALSRYRLKNSYALLFFMLITMAFPPMVTQIPIFIMLRDLNMLNTFAALVLPGMAHGYSIFLLKGFFDSLPKELYESASMDGAGEWTMFWNITMSLSKPILAVIALSAFTAAYSNFMFALLLCQDEKMWTIMVWLYQLQMNSGQGVIFASLLLAALPTFLVFAFCQNIIMRGIVVPSEK